MIFEILNQPLSLSVDIERKLCCQNQLVMKRESFISWLDKTFLDKWLLLLPSFWHRSGYFKPSLHLNSVDKAPSTYVTQWIRCHMKCHYQSKLVINITKSNHESWYEWACAMLTPGQGRGKLSLIGKNDTTS